MTVSVDRLNYFAGLEYCDPSDFLVRLQPLSDKVALSTATLANIRTLRTNKLKPVREMRQAALFVHGLSCWFQQKIWVAPVEGQDFDVVTVRIDGDTAKYRAIQLKELVPAHRNATATVQDLVDGLAKYPDSRDLCVAIYFNRNGRFESSELVIPKLNIGELWVYGQTADPSRWFMCGDLLADSLTTITFDHPALAMRRRPIEYGSIEYKMGRPEK